MANIPLRVINVVFTMVTLPMLKKRSFTTLLFKATTSPLFTKASVIASFLEKIT